MGKFHFPFRKYHQCSGMEHGSTRDWSRGWGKGSVTHGISVVGRDMKFVRTTSRLDPVTGNVCTRSVHGLVKGIQR